MGVAGVGDMIVRCVCSGWKILNFVSTHAEEQNTVLCNEAYYREISKSALPLQPYISH